FFVRWLPAWLFCLAEFNSSCAPDSDRRPFHARRHHSRAQLAPHFQEEVADEEMVRPSRTTFYFYPAYACAANTCLGRGRRLSLPIFLPHKRSAVWNERMERIA